MLDVVKDIPATNTHSAFLMKASMARSVQKTGVQMSQTVQKDEKPKNTKKECGFAFIDCCMIF